MASSALQVLGFILGVLAWVGMIGTCASPEWRKNSHGQTLIDNTLRYDGLWVRCKAFVTGQTHCDDYNEFFVDLPRVLQICRALMISSIGIGFLAIIITVMGMKCVSVGTRNHIVKARTALIGGLLFGIAGILTGAAVSYYAHGVLQEYYNPILANDLPMYLRFEYGNALFIGWASLVLGILCGVIVCSATIAILLHTPRIPPHHHGFTPVSIMPKSALNNQSSHQPYHLPATRKARTQKQTRFSDSNGTNGPPNFSSGASSNEYHSNEEIKLQTRRNMEGHNRRSKDLVAADVHSSMLNQRDTENTNTVHTVSQSLKAYV